MLRTMVFGFEQDPTVLRAYACAQNNFNKENKYGRLHSFPQRSFRPFPTFSQSCTYDSDKSVLKLVSWIGFT